jgi:DNA-binding transcriptional LysR family regulator
MDRLAALELFLAAADSQSFTKAALSANCSPTAASRAIAALEASLGFALFRRSTRRVALTEEGARYRDRIRPLLIELRSAGKFGGAHDEAPKGELHVTAPTMFGRMHVVPVIARLLADNPELSVRLLLIDRNVRLVEEGVDIAVRIGPLADSSLKAVKIGSVHPVIVASPAYLARRGAPSLVSDLTKHDLISTTGPRQAVQWRLEKRHRRLKPRFTVTTVEGAVAAAEAGVGLASLLSYQVVDALRTGNLIEVLGNITTSSLPVHLLFDGRLNGSNGRAAFIQAMRGVLKMTELPCQGSKTDIGHW